jgi:pimeloyl-ACP methyl ester carboxylesterase
MPTLERADGVEIHWEERGSGPVVILVSYWSYHPSAFGPIAAELSTDRRVVTYDDRGVGESTRAGPYDMATASADLAALISHLGEPVVLAGTADAPSRAVRAAAMEPDLVLGVVAVGGPPFRREDLGGSDSLVASESVVEAMLAQVETDYRGALRSLLTAANPQMTEDELRERVAAQVEHCPVEAAAPRIRAWASDDSSAEALSMGDRLWVVVSEQMASGWFPAGAEMATFVSNVLPEAHVVEADDGWMSRPDQTAAVIRGVTATVATGTADEKAVGA